MVAMVQRPLCPWVHGWAVLIALFLVVTETACFPTGRERGLSQKLSTLPHILKATSRLDRVPGENLTPSLTHNADTNTLLEQRMLDNTGEIAVMKNSRCLDDDILNARTTLSPTHSEQIHQLWNMIKSRGSIKSFESTDNDIVFDALSVAHAALRGGPHHQLEEAINKAAGVAAVLGELRADLTVILAGILHQVIHIFPNYVSNLTQRFGQDAVQLALSCNKLPVFTLNKEVFDQQDAIQAENHIQMLIVRAEDYRALYIRVAERLHTMRSLRRSCITENARYLIAMEARHVYAPLAHKMGITKVRGELEDLAFRILEPSMFQLTRYTQTAACKAYQDALEQILLLIQTDSILLRTKAQIRLTHRIKGKYQLYLKTIRKGLKSTNDVRDVLGLRLVVDTPHFDGESLQDHCNRNTAICYYMVDRMRKMPGWEPAEQGFKDYVLHAKESGYQSLHQYIRHLGLGTNVEVQVRTKDMHHGAELGEAAHWAYKDQTYRPSVARSKEYKLAWRSKKQRTARSAAELIGMAKQQILVSRVLVYWKDTSIVLNLQRGATALDAVVAATHRDGKTLHFSDCMLTVNDESVPPTFVLRMGDVVSINPAVTK